MNTNDADLEIPEITDFTGFRRVRRPRSPEGFEIRIDGAVEYSVRLIPSNKIVGRFASTREAWPVILAEVERGIPARCIVLDWHGPSGERGRVGGGKLLVFTAEAAIGRRATRVAS
jgi:hypothetical protein